jgi:hypothetical protein
MDAADLKVLQAASQVLNEAHPDRQSVDVLTEYASQNMPERLDLEPDELATVVALKLLKIPGDPKHA